MRELKEEACVDASVRVDDLDAMRGRLKGARERLDCCRLRRTRNWRTAVQHDQFLPRATALVSRQRFWDEACCAMRDAVLNSASKSEAWRAVREAILLCLQQFELVTMTRGGASGLDAKSCNIS